MATLNGVPVLTPGTYAGHAVTRETLARFVENFEALRKFPAIQPRLSLGHGTSGQPAMGMVARLFVDDAATLRADCVAVPKALRDLVKSGAYNSTSAEVIFEHEGSPAWHQGCGRTVRGPRLRGLAILGSEMPACAGTSLEELRDALRLEEERLPVTDFVGPDETVRCSMPRDVPLIVTLPALPASELHLAEGPTLLAGEWREASIAEWPAGLERAIQKEVITMAEIKRNMTAPIPANAGDVSGTDNLELTFLSALEGICSTMGWDRLDPLMRQKAADIVLRESDPSLDPGMDAVSRCVSDFNPRQGGPADAVTLVPGAHARAVAIGNAARGTKQGGPPIPINQSETDPFLARMSEVIAAASKRAGTPAPC